MVERQTRFPLSKHTYGSLVFQERTKYVTSPQSAIRSLPYCTEVDTHDVDIIYLFWGGDEHVVEKCQANQSINQSMSSLFV